MTIWQAHQIDSGHPLGIQIGPLEVWIKRLPDEWLIGRRYAVAADSVDVHYTGPPAVLESDPPEDLDYERWVARDSDTSITLVPVLPDRSMVARTDAPLFVPQHYQMTVYVSLPLWIRLETGSEAHPIRLCEIPTVCNSNTWFGDHVAGELCYSLQTLASSVNTESCLEPHRAATRLTLENATEEGALKFERICIRCQELTIFSDGNHFFTNTVHMVMKPGNMPDQIRYSSSGPDTGTTLTLVSAPRQAPRGGMLKAGLSDLRSWVAGV